MGKEGNKKDRRERKIRHGREQERTIKYTFLVVYLNICFPWSSFPFFYLIFLILY